jgi:hypothetical protein
MAPRKRKRQSSKRTLIQPHKGDKRYVRRTRVRFTNNCGAVIESGLAADLPTEMDSRLACVQYRTLTYASRAP